jgi:hypothetical protein
LRTGKIIALIVGYVVVSIIIALGLAATIAAIAAGITSNFGGGSVDGGQFFLSIFFSGLPQTFVWGFILGLIVIPCILCEMD